MARGRTVTILFTDLVRSTEMLQRLGDEKMEQMRHIHFRLLREAVADSGGEEVKSLGDGLMVVFTSSLDAVSCAVAMQRAVFLHNRDHPRQQFSVRVGLHSGEPFEQDGDYYGTPVVVARRMCDQAKGGQILISDLVRALVGTRGRFSFRTLGELSLKGMTIHMPAMEVVWQGEGGEVAELFVASLRDPARRKRLIAGIAGGIAAVAVILVLWRFVFPEWSEDAPARPAGKEEPATHPPRPTEPKRQTPSFDREALLGNWLERRKESAGGGHTALSLHDDGDGYADEHSPGAGWMKEFRWDMEGDVLRWKMEDETYEFRVQDVTERTLCLVGIRGIYQGEEHSFERLHNPEMIEPLLVGTWEHRWEENGRVKGEAYVFDDDGTAFRVSVPVGGEGLEEFQWEVDGPVLRLIKPDGREEFAIRHVSPAVIFVVGVSPEVKGEDILAGRIEHPGDTRSLLIGKWLEALEGNGRNDYCKRTFRADGTGLEEGRLRDDRWSEEFRWSLEGNMVRLALGEETLQLDIKSIGPVLLRLVVLTGEAKGGIMVMQRIEDKDSRKK